MSDHTPTLDGRTYTCPDCPWRAVLTTDGRVVQTQPGAAGHDHIGQALRQRAMAAAIVCATMDQLRRRYERGELGVARLKRLYRHIMTEHGL